MNETMNKSKEQLLSSKLLVELKDIARNLKLSVTGTKSVLVQRIVEKEREKEKERERAREEKEKRQSTQRKSIKDIRRKKIQAEKAAIIIQSNFRGFLIRQWMRYFWQFEEKDNEKRNSNNKDNKKYVNDVDLLTFNPISYNKAKQKNGGHVQWFNLFSFADNRGFIYGFECMTFLKMWATATSKYQPLLNPYNKEPIANNITTMFFKKNMKFFNLIPRLHPLYPRICNLLTQIANFVNNHIATTKSNNPVWQTPLFVSSSLSSSSSLPSSLVVSPCLIQNVAIRFLKMNIYQLYEVDCTIMLVIIPRFVTRISKLKEIVATIFPLTSEYGFDVFTPNGTINSSHIVVALDMVLHKIEQLCSAIICTSDNALNQTQKTLILIHLLNAMHESIQPLELKHDIEEFVQNLWY